MIVFADQLDTRTVKLLSPSPQFFSNSYFFFLMSSQVENKWIYPLILSYAFVETIFLHLWDTHINIYFTWW